MGVAARNAKIYLIQNYVSAKTLLNLHARRCLVVKQEQISKSTSVEERMKAVLEFDQQEEIYDTYYKNR